VATREELDGDSVEIVPDAPAEGDDIVVVPTSPRHRRQPPRRLIVAGAVVLLALGVALIIAVFAATNHDGNSAGSFHIQVFRPAPRPAPASSAPPHHAVAPVKRPVPTAVVANAPTTVAPAAHVLPSVSAPAASAVQGTASTAPAAPAKQYGATVLKWGAPPLLTVASGGTAQMLVIAHNPTDGTVFLSHPLSCTPRLDHTEVCPETVQYIPAGQSAAAKYTIDARGIAPGHYTLRIEGVLTVPVTVS